MVDLLIFDFNNSSNAPFIIEDVTEVISEVATSSAAKSVEEIDDKVYEAMLPMVDHQVREISMREYEMIQTKESEEIAHL